MTPTDRQIAQLSPDEQAELLKAVAEARDHTAFGALFRHYAPRIKAFLILRGLAAGQAEELAQEAMVNVWRKAASFDASRAGVSTWIFTIARNLSIDHLRRGSETLLGDFDAGDDGELLERLSSAEEDGADPAFDCVAGGQAARSLREAVDSLPFEQARILRLSFYEEMPHAEIAETLRLPLGTVKSRIRLAVAHLRRGLEHLKS